MVFSLCSRVCVWRTGVIIQKLFLIIIQYHELNNHDIVVEVARSSSDRHGLNFKSCVWRAT